MSAGGSFIRQVYGVPLPVVAASTGHAAAAGAPLLLGCDYCAGVDGPVKIGLNEVALADALEWALLIARERLSKRTSVSVANANSSMARRSGCRIPDEVTAADQVVTGRSKWRRGSQSSSMLAYASTVRVLCGDVLSQMDAAVAAERAAVGL